MVRTRRGLWLAVATVSLWAALPGAALALHAIPKGARAPRAGTSPARKPASPYDEALARYRAGIAGVVAARRERARAFLKSEWVESAQAVDDELKRRGNEILDDLRRRADASFAKRLSFDGEVIQSRVLRAGSSESAGLFATLLAEQRVAPADVVSHLMRDPVPLAAEWVPVLQDVTDRRDPSCWQEAVKVLYRAGISRGKYRPLLEEWALNGDRSALETLFLTRDTETGLERGDDDVCNRRLFGKLSGRGSPPEIRDVCADWAAEVGDRAAAEAVCTDLMWIPYKGRGIRASDREDPGDDALYRARVRAMSILYFKVQTDTAFKLVYDRANIIRAEQYEPETLPAGFREFSGNLSAQLEIDYAKGLIGELEEP